MGLRDMIEHNGKLFAVLAVIFGLPLPALAVISGLHWAFALGLFLLVLAATAPVGRLLGIGWGDWSRRVSRPRAAAAAGAALVLVALLIQAVPYGRSHDNPAVSAEPQWDSPRTRELVVKACFDCHSNEVEYPWYSNVAPISWAVQRHVDAGRHELNYSEWNRPPREADESAETVAEGSMPPWYYELVRPGLLSAGEKQELIKGLEATFGSEHGDGDEHEGGEDDD